MDIEGVEVDVLNQALDAGFLQKYVKSILIEWHLEEHPAEGERLKAFVVPKHQGGSGDDLRRELEALAAERLTPLEQPRAFTFGAAVPANPMGKRTDWRIE